uniref:W02B3.4-like N-terminal domain-containing protein n=1 Tax=Meloidogyne enterolobii TaxID=390850 RepID=A0A6V7VU00_MELEN|nr:unnamed protein product [Meloidogyne enterolobii]
MYVSYVCNRQPKIWRKLVILTKANSLKFPRNNLGKDLKINYDTFIRPLIVDFNCLENQNNGKNCTYPVAVAIPDGYPQISNEFIEIKFILDISESRDFWLFKNVNNSTDLIATRG